MTDFQTLRKIEEIEMLFNVAKKISVLLGAKEQSFLEAEAKLKELKDEFLKKVSGGIVADSAKNSQVDNGEYVVQNQPDRGSFFIDG